MRGSEAVHAGGGTGGGGKGAGEAPLCPTAGEGSFRCLAGELLEGSSLPWSESAKSVLR